MRIRIAFALGVAAVCAFAHAAPVVPERMAFDSLDRDSATGQAVRIQALLFKPEGSDATRRPAVVALHGCGGMYSAVPTRRERLSVRHQAMAELLVAEGYVVLFPDSFRFRGQEELCTIENRQRPITQANRRLDAQGALAAPLRLFIAGSDDWTAPQPCIAYLRAWLDR